MDILFPPDLKPNAMMFGVDDFTALDESATTGGMQSSALYGTRRWRLRMDFNVISRADGTLARFEALTAALRGRSNRAWISPAPAAKLRGSFPAVEMFANNDFSNGTAGWSASSQFSLSALDRAIRATRVQVSGSGNFSQNVALTAGVPYCARGFVGAGKGNASIQFADTVVGGFGGAVSQGMLEVGFTSVTGTDSILFFDPAASFAGNYFDIKWSSFSRCAQVDNGVNLLLNSDTPGTGTGWTLSAATAASGGGNLGPDGIADTWTITETATTAAHFTFETTVVAAAAADFSVSWFAKANLRTWCFIEVSNGTTAIFQWFNLSTGALGSSSVGAGFTLIGAIQVDCGNGWKRCILTFRKTDASTSLNSLFCASTGDTVQSYAGNSGSVALLTWRASLAPSSVPVQPIQTAGTAQTGTLQSGFNLNLKGLPLAAQGILLEGDVVECLQPVNSQLLRVVSRLDSDAAGLGALIFENALKQSPVDGAGVIVQQPMSRWVLAASTLGIEYSPGVFGQASLEFVEAA